MARLGENPALRILDDQAPGVLLDFDGAIVGAVGYLIGCLRVLPCSTLCAGLELRAEHHVILIVVLRLNGRCQHADAGRARRDELYAQPQRRIVLVSGIGEVEHLHAHRPEAIEVEGLTGRHAVALPLYQSLSLLSIEAHQRVGQEIGVRQVIEICRHVLLHTLQVLHTRIGLNLRIRSQRTTEGTNGHHEQLSHCIVFLFRFCRFPVRATA